MMTTCTCVSINIYIYTVHTHTHILSHTHVVTEKKKMSSDYRHTHIYIHTHTHIVTEKKKMSSDYRHIRQKEDFLQDYNLIIKNNIAVCNHVHGITSGVSHHSAL